MRISYASQEAIWSRRSEFHVLTYAEEGFSPLNIHTRDSTLSKDQLVQFAALVNDRNEVGSLYPASALSAVPRTAIRDLKSVDALSHHIEQFFRVNSQNILAKKVLIDFRTPIVSKLVIAAIQNVVACPDFASVDEIVVVDDAAP